VRDAGVDAASEVVGEARGEAPPRGERHGGWWRRSVGRCEPGASSDTGGAGASRPEMGWFDHGLCGGLNVWA
jgi:hypothetical protein